MMSDNPQRHLERARSFRSRISSMREPFDPEAELAAEFSAVEREAPLQRDLAEAFERMAKEYADRCSSSGNLTEEDAALIARARASGILK